MEALADSGLICPAALAVAIVVVLYLRSSTQWRARTRGLSLAPGPKGLPIVGNLFNMPRRFAFLAHVDLRKEFGDIIHFRVLDQSFVILASSKVLTEFLEKRAANTSDRAQSPMIELSGQSRIFGLLPYGQWWRRHRRAFWQFFHRDATIAYQPVQRASTHLFLNKLLENPGLFKQSMQFTFTASIMKILYGIDVKDEDDELIGIAEAAMEGFVQGLVPGKFLVEFIPLLRFIQPWIPGAQSPKLWKQWQDAGDRLAHVPYSLSKAQLDKGEGSQSIVGRLFTRLSPVQGSISEEDEEVVKSVGMVAYEGSTDTVFSALQAVFLGISLNPAALKNAQAELDAVVGPDRLPDFNDRESLVYIDAIIKEAMRWHVVIPSGVPHATVEDDELNGYFIPAGTVLIPATWACMHDPDVYEDPEDFRPERFIRDGKLAPTVRDPAEFIFGYGRRRCPGRHFAEASLFINVASVLHVFDIIPPLDPDGKPIRIQYKPTDGANSYPEDVRCNIRPRSAAAEGLIRQHAVGGQDE